MYWASPLCQGYGNKENIVPALEEKSRWDEKRKDEPSYRGLGGVGLVAGCVQMVINGKLFKWRNASWHQPVIYKKDKTVEENNLLIVFLMKNRRVHLIFLVLKICNFYSIDISQEKIQETIFFSAWFLLFSYIYIVNDTESKASLQFCNKINHYLVSVKWGMSPSCRDNTGWELICLHRAHIQ